MMARRAWSPEATAEATVGEAAWMAASYPQVSQKLDALRLAP